MKFSKSELDIIYQYAAPTKAETLAGMKEIVPVDVYKRQLKTEQVHNCTAKYSDYGQDSDNQNRTHDECNYLFTIFITIVIQEAHSFMS